MILLIFSMVVPYVPVTEGQRVVRKVPAVFLRYPQGAAETLPAHKQADRLFRSSQIRQPDPVKLTIYPKHNFRLHKKGLRLPGRLIGPFGASGFSAGTPEKQRAGRGSGFRSGQTAAQGQVFAAARQSRSAGLPPPAAQSVRFMPQPEKTDGRACQ